jgi:hypothetical protein
MSGITRRGFVKSAALVPLALTPFTPMVRQRSNSLVILGSLRIETAIGKLIGETRETF